MNSDWDPKNHPQYRHWEQKVRLENQVLLGTSESLTVPEMRHQFTNYDDLLNSEEFRKLEGPDSIAAYHSIRYTATSKALRHREYQLSEQRKILLEKREIYNRGQKELKRLYDAKVSENKDLAERLRDAKIKLGNFDKEWQEKILNLDDFHKNILEEKNKLFLECEQLKKDYSDALIKIKDLEKRLLETQGHRERLAKNNMSLGSYKGHFNRAQKKLSLTSLKNQELKSKLKEIQVYARKNNDQNLIAMADF
jgi:chromosome segregation ATPase